MAKRIVNTRVLPGEPTDGSGRACIHLFVQDEAGPFAEPHALHPALDDEGKQIKQKVEARPTRGRLACSRTRLVAPKTVRGVTTVTHRTDDPNAVTCPKCLASEDYLRAISTMKELAGEPAGES